MSNTVYPKAKEAAWSAQVDVTSGDMRVIFTSGGSYNSAHDNLDDVAATTNGPGYTLTGRTVTSGDLVTTTSNVVATFTSGVTINGAHLYMWTGTSSSSRLIGWMDTQADTTPINLVATGSSVTVTIPNPLIRF